MERELDAIGIKTCGDIYPQRHYLQRLFGDKTFEFLMGVHLGLGRTDVRPAEEFERKSVGTESTFHDLSDPKELRDKLQRTAEELERDLQRTEFKGRTLCLKVKLHTYEVFTRQVQPPKAVYSAHDLFHYSLPMLQKLQKEFPGMKLRLMGLRCTHLVSMKKGDVDFFGRARELSESKRSSDDISKIEVDEEGWQKWPDEDFENAAREEREAEMEELEKLSQEYALKENPPDPAGEHADDHSRDYQRYANGFAWRSLLEQESKKAEAEASDSKKPLMQWECPICSLPQIPDEVRFNEHIDGCLSRQTIKEIVSQSPAPQPLIPSNSTKRKRGKQPANGASDKRPKSSFFA